MSTFKALVIDRDAESKKQSLTVKQLSEDELMPGDVTIDVLASTVNYKDGLAITGKSPVVRKFPMIPGIDLVGTVSKSDSNAFAVGDRVLLNGFGVGETHMGAYAERARLSSDWLIQLPAGFTPHQAMAIGTAGYTAMLCVLALEKQGVTPQRGPVLVTGASGGVGSVAIAVLAKLGYHVMASTGRLEEESYLKGLGAREIIDRAELSDDGRPLGKERWAAAIDAVGSKTLANVLAQTCYGGAVAACGLAQGFDLPTTVMPFILRGVALLGVDSVMASKERRIEAYGRLAQDFDFAHIEALTKTIGFDDLPQAANDIVAGHVRGRLIVDIKG